MKIDFNNMVSIDLKGNLLFSIAPDFTRQFMITSWNSGMRFYLKTDDGWHEEFIDTGLMLIHDENIGLDDEPISLYLKQLPSELITLAKPYRYRQFSLLQLIAQKPQLFDIFKHSPNLFWMVIVEAENRDWDNQTIAGVLQQKREQIIKKMININCKKRVRFIQKLVFFQYIRCEFELIKKALRADEIVTAFDHWKSIPIQVVPIVVEFPYFINTLILENEIDMTKSLMSHQRKFWKYTGVIDDIGRIAQSMGTELTERYKSHLYNEATLNRLHANWVIRFNHSNAFIQYLLARAAEDENQQPLLDWQIVAGSDLPAEKIYLPTCPLGDCEEFIQLKNNFELLAEGADMHHCIGSYVNKALATDGSYFYKVLTPERGTVHIRYIDGDYSLVEFRLINNKQPSSLSYQAAYEWLEKNKK